VLYIYLPPQFVYKVGNTVIECEENRMQELACSHQLASPSPCLKKYRCSVCPNRLQLPRSFYPLTLRERNIHVPRAAVNSHDILQSSTIVTFEEVQRVAQSRSGSPFTIWIHRMRLYATHYFASFLHCILSHWESPLSSVLVQGPPHPSAQTWATVPPGVS